MAPSDRASFRNRLRRAAVARSTAGATSAPPGRTPATAGTPWPPHATASCEDLALTVSTHAADPLAGHGAFGSYHHAARAIRVRPSRSRADMAATLAHELAHAATHEASAALPRGAREAVAASVAYAVCPRFGPRPSLRSAGSVAGGLNDPDGLKAGMAAIHGGPAALIDAIAALLPDPDEPDLAASRVRRRRCQWRFGSPSVSWGHW